MVIKIEHKIPIPNDDDDDKNNPSDFRLIQKCFTSKHKNSVSIICIHTYIINKDYKSLLLSSVQTSTQLMPIRSDNQNK